jgi:hypothetical protein
MMLIPFLQILFTIALDFLLRRRRKEANYRHHFPKLFKRLWISRTFIYCHLALYAIFFADYPWWLQWVTGGSILVAQIVVMLCSSVSYYQRMGRALAYYGPRSPDYRVVSYFISSPESLALGAAQIALEASFAYILFGHAWQGFAAIGGSTLFLGSIMVFLFWLSHRKMYRLGKEELRRRYSDLSGNDERT